MASAKASGAASGIPNLRIAHYPGAIAVHTPEFMETNIKEIVSPSGY